MTERASGPKKDDVVGRMGEVEGPRTNERACLRVVDASAPITVDVLEMIAQAVAPRVGELLASKRSEEGLVDVALFVGETKQRRIAGPCRSGAVAGACKVARRWRAPRAAVEAWLRTLRPRASSTARAEREDDDLEMLRRRLAR